MLYCIQQSTYQLFEEEKKIKNYKSSNENDVEIEFTICVILHSTDQLSEEIKAGLVQRGHKVVTATELLSAVHAVMKENDQMQAYGDNRTVGAGGSQF